jgi:hypothetical protein
MSRNRRIQPPEWRPPSWKPAEVDASLEALRAYAEDYARASLDWYYAKKPAKALFSRVLRVGTILFTAIGGLMPVVSSAMGETALDSLRMNQYGYFSLGLAALFLALDRFLGSSTAWMRFIATAAGIETELERFRFDWAKLTAGMGGRTPNDAELQSLLARVSEFSAGVRGQVESETKAWVAEFQANLSELERRTEAAVRVAREMADQAQKDMASQKVAAAPGAIELTVANAGDTDAGYAVSIDGEVKKRGVAGSTCGVLGIPPGLREVSVSAEIGGAPASASRVVTVKAAEALEVSLTLTKTKSAAET